MAVTIRLARGGRKKAPFYRIVACDSRMKRDGRYLEKLGTYNPLTKECTIHQEGVDKWLKVGASTSERVAFLLKKYAGQGSAPKQPPAPKKEATPQSSPEKQPSPAEGAGQEQA